MFAYSLAHTLTHTELHTSLMHAHIFLSHTHTIVCGRCSSRSQDETWAVRRTHTRTHTHTHSHTHTHTWLLWLQQGEEDEDVDVEGEFESYTWAGQTRIRATTFVEGGLAGETSLPLTSQAPRRKRGHNVQCHAFRVETDLCLTPPRGQN